MSETKHCLQCGGPMAQKLHSPAIGEECLICVPETSEAFGNQPIERTAIQVSAAIRDMAEAGGHHIDVAVALVEFAKEVRNG